jgi:hypothetical protein
MLQRNRRARKMKRKGQAMKKRIPKDSLLKKYSLKILEEKWPG